MKTRLVITDVTRMHHGRVCIAGYDKEQRGVRPVLPPPGIPEAALEINGQAIIFPFALVELDLGAPRPQPPHTEDCDFAPYSVTFIQRVANREKVLSWSLYENVATIFEQPIQTDFGFYVKDCQGRRSLGTVIPKTIVKMIYGPDNRGAWDYRLHFYDQADAFYRLKIVDLTWHYYLDSLRGPDDEPAAIAEKLTGVLQQSQVYLRIGLARGWKEFPDRAYLQVTGIHTFPDYLEGKTFLDLRPHQVKENPDSYEIESEPPY
jgi:hypothetical protein